MFPKFFTITIAAFYFYVSQSFVFLDFCSQFLSSTYKFCSTIFSTNKVYLRYFYSLECLSYVFLPKFLNNCLFKIFIPKGFVITFFCYQKVYIKLFFLSLNLFCPINFIQQYNIFVNIFLFCLSSYFTKTIYFTSYYHTRPNELGCSGFF